MKAAEIKKGGKYVAKVSGVLTTVRVDEIREVMKASRNNYSGKTTYRDAVVYEVTNLRTGRRTTFRSAAKFRREVIEKPAMSVAEVNSRQGIEMEQAIGPVPETLAEQIRGRINRSF